MNSNSNILIIGAGKVGSATGLALRNQVVFHDPFKGIINDDYESYKYIIICVDTIQTGPFDYSDLESVLDNLEDKGYSGVVSIRSTVSPTKILEWDKKYSFDYIMFPEFLPQQEGRLLTEPSWAIVLGGEKQITKEFAAKLYSSGYPGDRELYRHVSKEESCIIKLADNAGLSTKLIYFNSIYKICEEFGASYDQVRSIIGLDARIGIQHSTVPSPDDGQLGFGGHCLPKDILAIAEIDTLGLFKTISNINKKLGR